MQTKLHPLFAGQLIGGEVMSASTMIERLLDGLDVAVEPPAHDRRDAGPVTLELGEDAVVRLWPDRVTITPPRTVMNGALAGKSLRIRATYRESINVFDHFSAPLEMPVALNDPIRRSFEDLLDEIAVSRPGRCGMAAALVRRIVILLLRWCLERGECPLPWVGVLADTQLGRVVSAMGERPQCNYTLSELAEVAGMSRTVFAARFTEAVSHPPMEFLRTVRLIRAAEFLTRTDLPIKAIAGRVGYSSRSSFTRAFIIYHHVTPKAMRARALESSGLRSISFGGRVRPAAREPQLGRTRPSPTGELIPRREPSDSVTGVLR